jgi:hypothetical protein
MNTVCSSKSLPEQPSIQPIHGDLRKPPRRTFLQGAMVRSALAALICLTSTSIVVACNIPVFRFALERWKSDACELVVFFERPLLPADDALIGELEQASTLSGGFANLNVLRVDVSQTMDQELQDLWIATKQKTDLVLPAAIVRSLKGKGQAINHWHGSLQELRAASLLSSPARSELLRRLQEGDSIVWLMIQSSDEKRNSAIRDILTAQCKQLPKSIQLPEGIGLPGSELYSEVPLLLQFSVLEIAPEDPAEQYLIRQISGVKFDAFRNGDPLIVPVFGRGRALEVIPADQLNPDLILELTEFLCGACSCQVKEQNPGFDLLLTTDWNLALFGEDAEGPPEDAADGSGQKKKPELIPIPPGRSKSNR